MMQGGEKVTANYIVRDEEMFVGYSLMSVAPHIARTIVFIDSRSKDNTQKIVEQVSRKVSTIEVSVKHISDQSFGRHREFQVEMSKTPFVLLLDGDQVFLREGLRRYLHWTEDGVMPEDINSVRVRYTQFYKDRFHVNSVSGPGPIRLCRTIWRGRRCRCSGTWPHEMHYYEGMQPKDMRFVIDYSVNLYHYAWVQKPYPRPHRPDPKTFGPFEGPQPEVFEEAII